MVQYVKDLEADLKAHPLSDPGGLVEVKVPLSEFGAAESVTAARPDGVDVRIREYRVRIRNGGTARVTELVNRFHSRTVRSFVHPILARAVGTGTQQRRPRTPRQSRHHRPDLPTLSQASCGA